MTAPHHDSGPLLRRLEDLFLTQAGNLGLTQLEPLEVRVLLARTAFSVFSREVGYAGTQAAARIAAALTALDHDDYCAASSQWNHAEKLSRTRSIFIAKLKDSVQGAGIVSGSEFTDYPIVGECDCGVDALKLLLDPPLDDVPDTAKVQAQATVPA